MTEQPMSLTEAAEVWSLPMRGDVINHRGVEAIEALRDHARATAAPGDLAALAGDLHAPSLDFGDDTMSSYLRAIAPVQSPVRAARLRAAADIIDAHRCAPAVEVATAAGESAIIGDWEIICDHLGVDPEATTEAVLVAIADLRKSTAPAAPQASEVASGERRAVVEALRGRGWGAFDVALGGGPSLDTAERIADVAIAALRDATPAPAVDEREAAGELPVSVLIDVLLDLADQDGLDGEEIARLAATSVEVVSGEEAAELRAWAHLEIEEGDQATTDRAARAMLRILDVIAPEPARPLAVGDTVTTVEELDALPVGAVLRSATDAVFLRTPDGWTRAGAEDTWSVKFPARVIDLPGGEQ